MRLLINRPESDALKLSEILKNFGYDIIISPVIEIKIKPIDLNQFDNISVYIVTSRNAVRCLDQSFPNKNIPIYVVGEGTAEEAREKKFSEIHNGLGDASGLYKKICRDLETDSGTLLYVCGKEVSFDMTGEFEKIGFKIEKIIGYEANEVTRFSEQINNIIYNNYLDGVVFFSQRSAAIFNKLIVNSDLKYQVENLKAFCLSKNIAKEVGNLKWNEIYISKKPNQNSIISLLTEYKN